MRSRNRHIYEKSGDLFFITSTIAGFINLFDSKECCDILFNSLKYCQLRGDFKIIGYIIMPNHFHLVIKIKAEGSVSQIIGNFKKYTSHQIVKYLENTDQTDILKTLALAAAKEPAADCRIWKPRFDCFVITNENTLRQKLEYIHNNPVRANLTDDPIKWHHSSACNYAGLSDSDLDIDVNWASLEYDKIPSGGTPDGAGKDCQRGMFAGDDIIHIDN